MQKIKLPTLHQLATLKSVVAPHLVITIKASAIAIAILALYYQDLNLIFNDALQNEATSHILAIPLLFIYLLYRKRKMLRAVITFETTNQPKNSKHIATLSGILLCIMTITLYWYGSRTFTPLEYHILTMPIFIAGLTLILFNPQTLRQIAFPIAFLIFLMPPPSLILYGLGSTLSIISSEASSTIVNALGMPSTVSNEFGNPTVIITKPDQTPIRFTVDIACSGIYSLIGFLIFVAFTAYIVRGKTWKKALTFLIGVPLIYLLNIMRITTLLIIGYHFGEQLALEVFHLIGGWTLIFLGTLLLLAITERLLKTQLFAKPKPLTLCQTCNPHPLNSSRAYCSNCGRLLKYTQTKLRKRDMAKIAIIAITMILLITIQAPVLALMEGPAQIIIQTPNGEQGNTEILPQIQGYTIQFLYRDKDFEQTAKQDASLLYLYKPSDKTKKDVFVAVEIASTRSSLHPWELCLLTWPQTHGYQPSVVQLDLRDIQILQNPPIIARYFAFRYTRYNQTQVVLYWFETSTFRINDTVQQSYVKISLISYPQTPQEVPEAENQILPFAIAIANYWQPMKTWTQLALVISQNGLAFTMGTATLLTFVIIFYVIEKIGTKKTNTNTYKKLSKITQQIIVAVQQTEQCTIPTLEEITKTHQSITSKNINKETLFQQLTEAEKTGLVSSQIISNQDEPIQTWKTNLERISQN